MAWYLLLKSGLVLAWFLPRRVLISLWANAFRVGGRFSPAWVTVAKNLELVAAAGGPAESPDSVFAHYGRYWGEWLAFQAAPDPRRLRIRVEGHGHLELAAIRGPVCVLSAHLGPFDLLASWLAQRLPGFTVAAEEVKPRRLFELFRGMRLRGGSETLVSDGQGRRFFRVLRDRGSIGLMADRVFGAGTQLGQGRRAAPLLGGYRHFPAAGMDLAQRAGATLLPIFMLREKDSQGRNAYVIKVHPPLPGGVDPVRAYASALESEILAHPEQWSVLYPLHDAEGIPASGGEVRAKGAAAQ